MIPIFGERGWREVNSGFPWVLSFNKWLRLSQLPDFSGETLYISSDYSGQGKESKFDVICILVADIDKSLEWEIQRCEVRRRYLMDGRRMAFKNLNDGQRRKALRPFLSAANEIHGLFLVVAIHKNIKTLCSNAEMFEWLKAERVLKAEWRFQAFERMFRIVHFVSLLIAGLAKPNQNIYWISDRDEILDGASRTADTQRILSSFTSLYVKFPLGQCGIGTTALDEGDRLEEDLAAIPDLAAGGVAELLTRLHATTGGKISGPITKMIPENLSQKTEVLLSWLEDERHLKKVKLCFDHSGGSQFCLGPFKTGWSNT